jgi:hypothetical protein
VSSCSAAVSQSMVAWTSGRSRVVEAQDEVSGLEAKLGEIPQLALFVHPDGTLKDEAEKVEKGESDTKVPDNKI